MQVDWPEIKVTKDPQGLTFFKDLGTQTSTGMAKKESGEEGERAKKTYR